MNKIVFYILLLFFFSSEAKSQTEYEKTEIYLVTISSGDFYWSAFGHSAIRIKTPDYDRMFGFGYFDFEDEDFFINFAKGNMQYFLGVVDSDYELAGYLEEGRQVVLQNLNLSVAQKQQLVEQLTFLAKPENRYYHYDYFLNNCTSKIRDLIDHVTGGEISSQLKPIQPKKSWNDHTFPVSNQSWVNLGIAVAYGLEAYIEKTQWQLSVFPEVFSEDLKNLNSPSKWNKEYEIYYQPSDREVENKKYSFIKTHFAVISIVTLLVLGLFFIKTNKATRILWLSTQSLLGIGIILLWFFTEHSVAAVNINLLMFSPFALLLLIKKTNKPFTLSVFLASNVIWLILALTLTNLYLIGFCLVNLLIWRSHKQA